MMSRIVLALLLCLFGIVLDDSHRQSHAQEWTRYNLPAVAKDIDGFTFSIELMSPEATGYMVVRWTANASNGTFPGDRNLELLLLANENGNWPPTAASYSANVMLESGKAQSSGVLYFPKYFEGSSMKLVLTELSEPLLGYAFNIRPNESTFAYTGQSLADLSPRYGVLLADNADGQPPAKPLVPDMRSIDFMFFPDSNYLLPESQQRLTDREAMDHFTSKSLLVKQVLRVSNAHEDWRGYEPIDILIVSYDVAFQLQQSQNPKWDAIRQWVSCGGVLWLYNASSREALGELLNVNIPAEPSSKDLEEFARADTKRDFLKDAPVDSWVLRQIKPSGINTEDERLLTMGADAMLKQLQQVNNPLAAMESLDSLQQRIVRVPLETGVVIGMLDDPFPGSHQYWHTVNYLSGANQVWSYRRATSLLQGSGNYWSWLLANVARPPVYAFLTLLSFFVLLVGPVAYYWTRRIGRSYLMFVIAPVLATLTTVSLFAYGLIADGLGAQARIRQITWVDAGTQRASRQTRSTYFTAFRQRDGLHFPNHVAVYPMSDPGVALDDFDSPGPSRDRRIRVTQDSQNLQGEFLPSRSQRQYMTYSPLPGEYFIKQQNLQDNTLQLVCNTDVKTSQIVLRDRDGKYWLSTSPSAPGETCIATPLAQAEVGKTLRAFYMNYQPQTPFGYSSSGYSMRNRYGYYSFQTNSTSEAGRSWAHPNDELGLYESKLRSMLLDTGEMPKNWFVAIAELSSDANAIPSAESVESVHYLMGTWQ
jgi:hypothetical protein